LSVCQCQCVSSPLAKVIPDPARHGGMIRVLRRRCHFLAVAPLLRMSWCSTSNPILGSINGKTCHKMVLGVSDAASAVGVRWKARDVCVRHHEREREPLCPGNGCGIIKWAAGWAPLCEFDETRPSAPLFPGSMRVLSCWGRLKGSRRRSSVQPGKRCCW